MMPTPAATPVGDHTLTRPDGRRVALRSCLMPGPFARARPLGFVCTRIACTEVWRDQSFHNAELAGAL
jgi:hypothetical protein